jgi:hypothetical protein
VLKFLWPAMHSTKEWIYVWMYTKSLYRDSEVDPLKSDYFHLCSVFYLQHLAALCLNWSCFEQPLCHCRAYTVFIFTSLKQKQKINQRAERFSAANLAEEKLSLKSWPQHFISFDLSRVLVVEITAKTHYNWGAYLFFSAKHFSVTKRLNT